MGVFHADAFEHQNTKFEVREPSVVGIFILPASGVAKSDGLSDIPADRTFGDVVDADPFDDSLAGVLDCSDRYDALRSRRPYKEAYIHEKTLAVMTDDDRSGISGYEWYGDDIWGVFEKHHLHFRDVFEGMQNYKR